MRLTSNRLPKAGYQSEAANDVDPREGQSAEIIDLASRNTYPVVANRKTKSDGLGLAAGVAIVAMLGAVTLWSMNSARLTEPEGIGGAENVGAQAPQQAPGDFAVAPAPIGEPQVQPGYGESAPQPVAAPASSPDYSSPPAPIGDPSIAPSPRANGLSSPAMVFDASSSAVPQLDGNGEPVAAMGDSDGVGSDTSEVSRFASRIGGVGGAPAQASAMTNPSTTVTQGTLIPAILETAIDTNVPGFVRAVVSKDVRSFDGTKVLVPRSSRLIGQYQSGLQNGQKRAYVIWTRLIRPDGASVNLASPAIGFDGTTGLQGKVKSNFFQRFGSALLLSVVGGLSNLASGGTSVVLGGGQSAAAAAFERDGQIGPTVRVKQGQPIRIFTARDLDFTTVSN
ncbi:TrbI/VirB10 family protein [Qipengyuania atrilutea]|uniref:Type VI secretion protein n=1 Tax=Qipengyuania atrilutea TaxID=2744473 RepID=A0A850H8J1_9SPHN|nr:TrbI/VirB10 family protein [Actirhodobacter atriluteus]NVD43409.1 type VI secretion protein [Actirhodobacter atriluteus]